LTPSLPPADHDEAAPETSDATIAAHPHRRQLALQAAAAFAVLSLAWPYFGIRNEVLPWPQTAFAIGAVAFVLATLTRQRWWWRAIHTLFAPLAWAVSLLAIDPGWFLLGIVVLLLVYRGALSGQIPLYLSNRATAAALARLTQNYPAVRFIDLGAGLASVLRELAKLSPEAKLAGIENAPATWLVGFLRTRALAECRWLWGDLWRIDLGDYDVVYAFLSPAAMPGLWEKVVREMRPGSLFVSNSFAVPDVAASEVIEVDDARQTRLYCYRR
jgi:SAM-dependent methyltransferase